MYHYLFTNDLRISSLQSALTKAGNCFVTNTVPSASEDKSENNNMKTLGFYFNLTENSNCAKECQNGNIRKVVLNFIKKFQFPNPRTQESLVDTFVDGITIAPMRLVLQVLYNMLFLYPEAAHLTRDEILNFFFYNSAVAKNTNPNIIELIQQIIEYRKTNVFPSTVEIDSDKRNWKQEDRQIREMVKLLLYSGCISENESQELYIKHDDLTVENKAALFDILTYTRFWMPDSKQNYNANRASYENYMDVESLTDDESDNLYNDVLAYDIYGIHIKLLNNALSDTNPHICIGWSAMGDLFSVNTKDELIAKYDATWPGVGSRKKGQDIGQIWRFVKEMNIGDYVVFADGNVCHIGQITSDYYFDNTACANQDPDYANVRDVQWLKKDIPRSDLSDAFHHSLMTAKSIWTLNDYKAAVYALINDSYKKDDELISGEDIEIEADDIGNNYSITELGQILSNMYDSADNKTTAIHMFGIKYAEIIIKKGYTASQIIKASTLQDSYHVEINKGVSIYKSIKDNEYGIRFYDPIEIEITKFDFNFIKGNGINKIFYGVPGCGKSYHIEHDILGKDNAIKKYSGVYAEENIIRTTFYQDYSNTDFVGQILPKIVKGENGEKDTVEYIFNPGPFTLALIQAISNPTKKVALVIEEINRGNAPAIFGDIFQLLDRDDDSISEYGIVNVGMIDYLNAYEFEVDGEKKRYKFKDIKIPGNMDIFATMNTSDQNVYTLDTAFTRRWAKERIPNVFNGNDISDFFVPGMEPYTWGMFVDAINTQIQNKLDDLQVNEDKQVGAFFIKKSDLIGVNETLSSAESKAKAISFAHKVLEYLWDDVSKLDHSVIFNPKYTTFEKVVEDYITNGVSIFNREIFKNKSTQDVSEETN